MSIIDNKYFHKKEAYSQGRLHPTAECPYGDMDDVNNPRIEEARAFENGELGYHTKECNLEPYGYNQALDDILSLLRGRL